MNADRRAKDIADWLASETDTDWLHLDNDAVVYIAAAIRAAEQVAEQRGAAAGRGEAIALLIEAGLITDEKVSQIINDIRARQPQQETA